MRATQGSFNTYRSLLARAGKWNATNRKFAEDQVKIAVFVDAISQNEYDKMALDIWVAVGTANRGFQAKGKPLTHATATALDVLRAIRWHNAAPKDWAFNEALYRRIALESSGDRFAQNRSSSAFGRVQFLNGTWGTVGCSKTSDGVEQSKCGLRYIAQRYGHPNNVPASGSY
jgi:phage tail protein X